MAPSAGAAESRGSHSLNGGDDRYREIIANQALNVIRSYLSERDLDQSNSKELKEIIENVLATDYDGRTVLELLQNAHDAHSKEHSDGRIHVRLDPREGDFGVLYVANSGVPFRDENFRSICKIAMSSKPPSEGIGNKGIGFKSVLQLSLEPEIFSKSALVSDTFDGYCFRFARPDDFDDLANAVAPEEEGLADQLRENVPSLKVPIEISTVPSAAERLCEAGYVTVIRLPLRSSQARSRARQEIDSLLDSEVPFHLFLDRVSAITFEVVDEPDNDCMLTRTPRPLGADGLLSTEVLELQDGTTYIALHAVVPEKAMRSAIAESRDEGRLGSSWERWEGDARVSCALRVDGPMASGRLYTFLPMADSAPVPLRGLVNAPFFAHLNRRDLELGVPLNALLLGSLANACASAVTSGVDGPLRLGGEHLVDLVTWLPGFRHYLDAAFAALGTAVGAQRCIPALGDARTFANLEECWSWSNAGEVFNAEKVSAATGVKFFAWTLGPVRIDALKSLADHCGWNTAPDLTTLAGWSEDLAVFLQAQSPDGATWAQFFDDLADVFTNTESLTGRALVPADDGSLLVAGDESGLSIFFAPQGDDEEGEVAVPPPPEIAASLAFTRRDIPWNRLQGNRRTRRSGRAWLEQNRLVRAYRSGPVLEAVGEAMVQLPADESEGHRRLLAFAYAVWAGARDVSEEIMRAAQLRVPTQSGWIPAEKAIFSPGWSGQHDEHDRLVTRFVDASSSVSKSVAEFASRMLLEPSAFGQDIAAESVAAFLEAAGVKHGLQPNWISVNDIEINGEYVNAPEVLPQLPNLQVDQKDQAAWLGVCARWPRRPVHYPTVAYRPDTTLAFLPGQSDLDAMDDMARRSFSELVIRGLKTWPDHALTINWTRHTDKQGAEWPSLAGAFLATAAWVPQSAPGDRSTLSYVPPCDAWWLAEQDTVDYLPAQPAPLRRLTDARVLSRLSMLGVRIWDTPESARDRVIELTARGATRAGGTNALFHFQIRKAYEEAWSEVRQTVDRDAYMEWAARLSEVLVMRREMLGSERLDAPGEVVYYGDAAGPQQLALIKKLPVSCLPFRRADISEAVAEVLAPLHALEFRPSSKAEVSLLADGRPVSELATEPLLAPGREWVSDLVHAVIEFKSSSIAPPSRGSIQQALRSLQRIDVARASSVATTVDGLSLDGGERGVVAVPTERGHTIVVTEWASVQADTWMEDAAPAIMDAIGFGSLGVHLKVALVDLRRRVGSNQSPTQADIAVVLEVPVADLIAAGAESALSAGLVRSVIPLAACFDEDAARLLMETSDEFGSRQQLCDWVGDRLRGVEAGQLVELAEAGDLLESLRVLGIEFATANSAFRRVGLPPLRNEAGQQRQFEAYLLRNRSVIVDALRTAHLPTYREGGDLSEYVSLLLHAGPSPDPAWLETTWDLDPVMMQARINDWFDEHSIVFAPSELPPLDELRDANRRTVGQALTRAKPVVEAWLGKAGIAEGSELPSFEAVAGEMLQSGHLDFEQLHENDVVRWIATQGQWPAAMPQTLRYAELGLTSEEVQAARAAISRREDLARRTSLSVTFGGEQFALDDDGFRELAAAIDSGIAQSDVAVDLEPVRLAHPGVITTGRKGKSGRSGSGPGRERVPAEMKEAIGLAGEVAAGRWLEAQYGVSPDETWVSGYRDKVLGGNRGDDGLGYDFRVVTPEQVLFFEVKSTTGTDPEIRLGESQVRCAQTLGPGEDFRIIFVVNVLDPGLRQPFVLPNPFASHGLDSYRMLGQDFRLRFVLPVVDAAG